MKFQIRRPAPVIVEANQFHGPAAAPIGVYVRKDGTCYVVSTLSSFNAFSSLNAQSVVEEVNVVDGDWIILEDPPGDGTRARACKPDIFEKCYEPIDDTPEKRNMPEPPKHARPGIVCLCGSTRFMETFFEQGWRLTLEGFIVLSVGVCKHAEHHGAEALGPEVAKQLDELHLRKIDLCDEVLVLNVGGYIGESTRNEIEYAERTGKPIRYLETEDGSCNAEKLYEPVKDAPKADGPDKAVVRPWRIESGRVCCSVSGIQMEVSHPVAEHNALVAEVERLRAKRDVPPEQ